MIICRPYNIRVFLHPLNVRIDPLNGSNRTALRIQQPEENICRTSFARLPDHGPRTFLEQDNRWIQVILAANILAYHLGEPNAREVFVQCLHEDSLSSTLCSSILPDDQSAGGINCQIRTLLMARHVTNKRILAGYGHHCSTQKRHLSYGKQHQTQQT